MIWRRLYTKCYGIFRIFVARASFDEPFYQDILPKMTNELSMMQAWTCPPSHEQEFY